MLGDMRLKNIGQAQSGQCGLDHHRRVVEDGRSLDGDLDRSRAIPECPAEKVAMAGGAVVEAIVRGKILSPRSAKVLHFLMR